MFGYGRAVEEPLSFLALQCFFEASSSALLVDRLNVGERGTEKQQNGTHSAVSYNILRMIYPTEEIVPLSYIIER